MSIEDLARAASADLWTRTTPDLDAGLDAVHAMHSRRRRQARVTVALAAAAAVAAAWWGGATFGGHATSLEPARPSVCADPMVACQGDRSYRFALDAPVLWHIPRGFGVDSGAGATSRTVESYWSHHGIPAGVSVMEHVRAASQKNEAAHPAGVPTTAAGFTAWLAARPWLHATAPRRTKLAGHDAWQVRVSLRGRATVGPARCLQDTTPCRVVTSDPLVSGVWGRMVADYTAFDLPGSGTVVVWSWAFGHDTAALDRSQQLVDGLSWPTD